jgi:hypothetical protein
LFQETYVSECATSLRVRFCTGQLFSLPFLFPHGQMKLKFVLEIAI